MKRLVVIIAALAAILPAAFAQPRGSERQKLPVDSAVTIGTLKNGIRYYIRENQKPEKRAELRLVVNAGSILEDDSQQGLAHFLEHMAFNGTKHFARHELIDYLESVGMRFGADLNAYTGFDQTVFMFEIPTDTASVVEKGFDILEDWSHLISLQDDEIDKERGVIIEEWRLGRGADARMRDKQFPILFKDSRYAERMPIGKPQIIETFKHDTLRKFYHDWYRPDLMAVIAVGDFNGKKVEQLIRKHFSGVPMPPSPRKRVEYPVPDHAETLYAIATDSEATSTDFAVIFKHAVEPEGTAQDYRRTIIEGLYNAMLNERFAELARQADPPFVSAGSNDSRLVRTKEAYMLSAQVRQGGILRGLGAVLTEAARVRRFGFTMTELERQKAEMLSAMENAYQERNKTESSSFAAEYIRNYLVDEPIPGIAREYQMYKAFLPGITLQEVNALGSYWIRDSNRVISVSAPTSSPVPTPAELAATIDSVAHTQIQAYVDTVTSQPLVANPPAPGTIVSTKERPELGVTEWTLSNGVRVVLKPTDFKNDEVGFSAFKPGGTSLAPDSNYIPAATAAGVVAEGGVGRFDRTTLQKLLAGKLVGVSPFISELDEGFNGGSSIKDLPTMFQLIYLYATAPRADSTAFISRRARIRAMLENRSARPESAFQDTVVVTLAQHHFRRRPFTLPVLDEMSLSKSMQFYRQSFSDFGDMTFIIVGSFSPDSIKPLVLTYLGSLPNTSGEEKWRDVGVRPPKGLVQKDIHRGIEPKSLVQLLFTGPTKWSVEEIHDLDALASVLRIKLREVVREEKSGTYGVSVSAASFHYPDQEYRIGISFGCDPQRVDELTGTVFQVIDTLKQKTPDPSYIEKVKETLRREYETNLKQNDFWLSSLQFYYSNDVDPDQILHEPEAINTITPKSVQEAADRYFDMKNYIRVVLFPERLTSGDGGKK